ncbi:MAG TPA: peptidoglycan bridge formation glycyltransferase FemA/FemB family protein [Patescibacteria group bacterium]|nr:peptidoglycan bridge formation glycyltransferase FemA/FemB family protein [Patescibacteria group bacterium]
MPTVRIITEESKTAFNHLAAHPLQSWAWGEFRRLQGHRVWRLGLFEDAKPTQVFQITFHRLPQLPFSVGYLPKSSLPTPTVIAELKKLGQQEKAIFIKIEPHVEAKKGGGVGEPEKLGLLPGKPLFTKFTSIIDLSASEDELFQRLKPKTRYNIRLAQKHGVTVKEDDSDEAFEVYLKLLFETTHRQGFYAHDEDYHRLQWQILRPAGISHLLTATYQGKMLAAFLLFVFNNTLYYPYGASTREHRELMAPTLLMWEAIRFGKNQGCQQFDLWGDLEPNPPPNHPYFGFHRFKEGFSPRLVEFIGSYDLVIQPLLYQLFQKIDRLRWKVLHLKAKVKS